MVGSLSTWVVIHFYNSNEQNVSLTDCNETKLSIYGVRSRLLKKIVGFYTNAIDLSIVFFFLFFLLYWQIIGSGINETINRISSVLNRHTWRPFKNCFPRDWCSIKFFFFSNNLHFCISTFQIAVHTTWQYYDNDYVVINNVICTE